MFDLTKIKVFDSYNEWQFNDHPMYEDAEKVYLHLKIIRYDRSLKVGHQVMLCYKAQFRDSENLVDLWILEKYSEFIEDDNCYLFGFKVFSDDLSAHPIINTTKKIKNNLVKSDKMFA